MMPSSPFVKASRRVSRRMINQSKKSTDGCAERLLTARIRFSVPHRCRPSSAASAAPPARSLSSAPTTDANASGWLHPHGCSSAGPAPSIAGSAKAPSATCSTPRWSHRPDRPGHRQPVAFHSARLPQDVHHRRHLERAAPHIAQVIAGHHTSTSRSATRPSIPRRPSRPTGRSWPAGAACGPARNIAPPPTRSGPSSSATSNAGRSPSGPAGGRSPRPASTSTRVSAARCCGQTRPNAIGWWRSATT